MNQSSTPNHNRVLKNSRADPRGWRLGGGLALMLGLLALLPRESLPPTAEPVNGGSTQAPQTAALVAPLDPREPLPPEASAWVESTALSGDGWRIKLNPGWSVRRGSRSGDYQIISDDQ